MSWYRPILCLHIIAVISWMAGILYLYRLLVYATEQGCENPAVYDLLKTMSRRLAKAITVPAMIVSWIAGLTMTAINPTLWQTPWFHAKFVAILCLTAATIYAYRLMARYQRGGEPLPRSKTLRLLNEIPTLLMIVIVCLAILKP